jgi:hypothetical protein
VNHAAEHVLERMRDCPVRSTPGLEQVPTPPNAAWHTVVNKEFSQYPNHSNHCFFVFNWQKCKSWAVAWIGNAAFAHKLFSACPALLQ